MSDPTYTTSNVRQPKRIVWLHGEIKTTPFSTVARQKTGELLRQLQEGEAVSMPHSRPMPTIGPRCHELRVKDHGVERRVIYRVDFDAIVIIDVFEKSSRKTPRHMISVWQNR